jgi:hypothetical protein
MKNIVVVLLVVASLAASIFTPAAMADNGLSLAAQHEAARRGTYVERVGGGLEGPGSSYSAAMAPPAVDADKWQISLYILPGVCPPCDLLKKDFATAKELAPFVNVNDPHASACHFHIVRSDDPTQRWRIKQSPGLPAVVIQPPTSGKFGDPTQCLEPITGYHKPGEMAELIRGRIRDYIEDYDAAQKPMVRYRAAAMGLASNRELPFELPPNVETRASDVGGVADQISNELAIFFSDINEGQMLTTILLLAGLGFLVVREYRRDTGKKLIVNDEQTTAIEKVAKIDPAIANVIATTVAAMLAATGKDKAPNAP